MSEDESKREPSDEGERDEDSEDRSMIFARRKMLVSAALAGVAMSTAGCDQLKRAIGIGADPQPCLSPPEPPPQVCLAYRPTEPQACLSVPIQPQVCLSPRVEEPPPDAGGAAVDPLSGMRDPNAMPCLAAMDPRRDPPRPRVCLSRVPSRPRACLGATQSDNMFKDTNESDDES
ncbi:MAG: hypothetical protein U0269_09230 [Polyangiales bacterium]